MRSPDVTLKHYDVARKWHDVENRAQVNKDMRIATNSQIVLTQVSIDLISSRSLDRRCYLHAKVNTITTDSTITGIRQLMSSTSPKIAEWLI